MLQRLLRLHHQGDEVWFVVIEPLHRHLVGPVTKAPVFVGGAASASHGDCGTDGDRATRVV